MLNVVAAQIDRLPPEYIRTYHNTCYHACGTASMLPREKNGVVDPKLKVSLLASLQYSSC